MVNVHADGFLREHYKEKVIATFDIRVPDLTKHPFMEDGSIRLPVAGFKWKECGLQQISPINNVAYLELQILDLTRADAAIVYNPNRDIMEDRPYIHEYNIKQI